PRRWPCCRTCWAAASAPRSANAGGRWCRRSTTWPCGPSSTTSSGGCGRSTPSTAPDRRDGGRVATSASEGLPLPGALVPAQPAPAVGVPDDVGAPGGVPLGVVLGRLAGRCGPGLTAGCHRRATGAGRRARLALRGRGRGLRLALGAGVRGRRNRLAGGRGGGRGGRATAGAGRGPGRRHPGRGLLPAAGLGRGGRWRGAAGTLGGVRRRGCARWGRALIRCRRALAGRARGGRAGRGRALVGRAGAGRPRGRRGGTTGRWAGRGRRTPAGRRGLR